MPILSQLQQNKGTVSSALGKALAEKALQGDTGIIQEAVELAVCSDKNVRAGAAKIIEKVAEKKPAMVARYLKDLSPALEMPEPQTRWMIIHTFGLCAKLNAVFSCQASKKAEQFLKTDSGVCLWDRTIIYFGYIGALSEKQAQRVFPILGKALTTIPSQTKTILESFEKMIPVLDADMKKKVLAYAKKYSTDKKPSIKSKAVKLLKILAI